jgi:Tol biopolymer transport system component
MRNGRIAICLLAVATLACQFLTMGLEAPATRLPATAAPANPSYAPTGQTSAPKALLSQNGPWIVFSESDGLYAANMDGSMATKVFDLTPFNDLSSIAPTGGRFAIMTANDVKGRHGLTLHIFHLPDGKEEKTIPLTGPQSESPPNVAQDDPRLFPLKYFGTSQWSPDGRQLAFDAGKNGDNSDLYLYSTVVAQSPDAFRP